MRLLATALCALLSLPALAHESASAPAGATAQSDFERLKSLAGDWAADTDGDGQADSTFTYRLSAGGSVLVETLFAGTPHEMLTLYHMDGERLLATHYCAAGNQPRMRWVPSGAANTVAFEFVDGTNMKSVRDMHMGSGRITLVDADHAAGEWQAWQDRQPGHLAKMTLTRKKPAKM